MHEKVEKALTESVEADRSRLAPSLNVQSSTLDSIRIYATDMHRSEMLRRGSEARNWFLRRGLP
jgi:hypothetical protein